MCDEVGVLEMLLLLLPIAFVRFSHPDCPDSPSGFCLAVRAMELFFCGCWKIRGLLNDWFNTFELLFFFFFFSFFFLLLLFLRGGGGAEREREGRALSLSLSLSLSVCLCV